LPAIWLSSHHGSSGDTVLAGNYQIGKLAANYLMDRGHQHLGFLSAMGHYPAYPARAEAFQFTAARRKLEVTTFIDERPKAVAGEVSDMTVMRVTIDELVASLAKHTPRITGLFVPNDIMTSVVYASLQRHDIK